MENIELTILMPCLNEEKSIGFCISEAKSYLENSGVCGEILICDNLSTDKSAEIAESLGARVISIKEKGYGSAIIAGIHNAYGKYIIMGDSDGSYDFSSLSPFVKKLREGYLLVMGNRFSGRIEKGAMPFSHKLGVPFLSWCARVKFKAKIGDFHCGLRGFERKYALSLGLKCRGMEFATEMIAKFSKSGAKICEIPTTLRRDKRCGRAHLRTVRDGLRHLRFILFSK